MDHLLKQLAHSLPTNGTSYVPGDDLEHTIGNLSANTVIWGSVLLVVLLILAALIRDRVPKLKMPLFILSIFNVFVVTAIIIGSTIYLNQKSVSGGPVHWHTDFELWACGQELELRDPIGRFSNKIGSSTLHEHNDKRIHLEGVVVEDKDASLGKFFYVIGGGINESSLLVPLNDPSRGSYFESDTDGQADTAIQAAVAENYFSKDEEGTFATFINGQSCPDGTAAEVQTFVYSVKKDGQGNPVKRLVDGKEKTVYSQQKLSTPATYKIADESVVPPGDCVIIEFAPLKETTEHICLQYEVQEDELNNYIYEPPQALPIPPTPPSENIEASEEPDA